MIEPSKKERRRVTPQFGRINRAAKGAMSPANYRDLYREASALGKGTIVEIGPAQGAGTIVLGLAAKKNPNIERIISIDAFEKSQHLISLDNVEDNIRELRKNLSSFHCGERVTIMTAGHEDWEMIKHSRITMLVIDADGGLDRDFSNYYNLLVPGATVFVDDYCAVLNEQAKNYYTRERTGCLDSPEEDAREYLHKPSPLGKQYMTKCFIDYLIREGLLEEKSIRNRTITLVKSKTNPFFTEKHLTDMQQIRARMKEKLLRVRRETLRIVRQLDPQLERIQAAAECEELLVMRGIPVDHDIRYYPVYGLGKNGKPASDIGRIYEKHIRDSVSGERQFIPLKRGRRRNKAKYALVICGQAGKKPFMLPSDWKKKLTATLNTVEEETQALFKTTDLSSL